MQLAYNSDMSVAELKVKVKETIETFNKADGKEAVQLQSPYIGKVKNLRIIEFAMNNETLGDIITDGYEIHAFERPYSGNDYYQVELMIQQPRSSLWFFSQNKQLTMSRIVSLKKDITERKIKKRIFKILRPLIQAPEIAHLLKGKEDEETILDLEFKHFFENENRDEEEPIYTLQILNNGQAGGFFFGEREACSVCKNYHKDNCDYSFGDKTIQLSDIVNSMRRDQSLVLVVNWRAQNPKANMTFIEKPFVEEISEDKDQNVDSFESKSSEINLYDCLSYFGVEETLKGGDKWFCPKCKDHVVAKKKMEVFKSPNCLIIHLKRFSHTRGMFGSRKLTEKIKFPVEDLNMTQYVIKQNGGKVIYDLYAVSNHFGSLGGGHYTAFAKNPLYDKWFEFDDSSVNKIASGDVQSNAAYVLFYKKR